MLDRQKGNFIFECEGCGSILETNTGDWDSALNVLRRNKWKARIYGGEWHHECSECQEKK
jgi:Fe2+ or Zn2+ uptake regulation protein